MTSESKDYLYDPNLSLREKLRRHMQEKKSSKFMAWSSDPVFLNRWGPWFLLFLLCGAGGWGTLVAMPVLYAECWEGWLVLGRVFVGVMVLEATVNWSLTRWVTSEYRPAIHGTKPSDFSYENGTSDSSEDANTREKAKENNSVSCSLNRNPSGDTNGVCEQRGYVATGFNVTIDRAKDGEAVPKSPTKTRSYDGYSHRVWVAVALPTEDGHVERKSCPYWSWVNCLLCQRPRPPRCHHCTLCHKCVLKRDHHCYMTGACIGASNQRFFLVFLFWGSLLTLFGTVHMLPYTFYHVVPDYNVSVFDFIPPVSIARGLLGYVHLVIGFLSILFWLLLLFVFTALSMLINFVYMLVKGQTSFEHNNGIKVTDTRSLSGKLCSVFGDYWWLNLLVPMYPWMPPVEDAVLWPHIKPANG